MTRPKDLDFRVAVSRANDFALLAAGYETGFWDDNGVPAPWPEDFFDLDGGWRPATSTPSEPAPGEPPF